METKKGFKVSQCFSVKVITERFNHSFIPTILIKFPIQSLFLFTVICFVLLMASMAHAGGVIQLPQTGQTKCYDTAGTELTSCTGTGQDGEIQAGVPWPSPRFTPGIDAESDCITDNLTGLMWPKNGNLAGGTKTWNDAIDYANNLTLCGYSDWRLPNLNELESLVNASQSGPAAWLNTQGFNNVQSNDYWFSTTYAGSTGGAWETNMWSGGVNSSNKLSTYSAWPVRAVSGGSFGNSVVWRTGQTASYRAGDDGDLKQGASWPSPRFTDQGNGEVIDNLTGLFWTKDAKTPGPSQCSPGVGKTWQDALDYVKCLNRENYLGYSDWRLPNRKELHSISDYSLTDTGTPSVLPFTNIQSNYYWSSTTYARSADSAWCVLWYGSLTNGSKYYTYYVWPVRSRQSVSYSISGTVKDFSNSHLIPGATITVKDVSGGTTVTTATSDGSGNYTAIIPLKGDYVLSANKTGYEEYTQIEPPFTLTDTSPNATLNMYIVPLGADALISLKPGWNFISLPRQPPNTAIGEVLKEVSSNVRIIWAYDNDKKNWLKYKAGQTSTFNTMEPGKGYWLYVDASGNITMTGWNPLSSTQVHLFDGWNLIGYAGTDGKDIATALTGISTKWNIIWNWTDGKWYGKHMVIPTLPDPIQPLSVFNLGKAYWIRIKTGQATDWTQ